MAGYRQTELRKSYIRTPPAISHVSSTIPDRIRDLAKGDPDKLAFVFREPGQPRITLTRKKLSDMAETFGTHFVKLGIKAGDRVATLISGGENWLTVQFGLYIAGATAVNSLSFDLNEFTEIAKKLNCVATIVEETLSLQDNSVQGKAKVTVLTLQHINNHPNAGEKVNLTELMDKIPPENISFPIVSPDAEVVMLMTSGSSGVPKLVVHTHTSILTGAFSYAEASMLDNTHIFTLDRPMSWIGGYPMMYLGSGCTMVYVNLIVEPEAESDFFADVILNEQSTAALLMEYKIKSILKSGMPLPTVPRGFTGGQRLSEKTATSLLSICKEGTVGYGSTECLQIIRLQFQDSAGIKDGTIGYATSGCEVKVIGDEGDVLDVGKEGELCIRTPACSKEFMFLDGTRENVKDKDDWYHTGDICVFELDGLLIVRGRKTEMIKRATVKIFPSFIEKRLRENLDIAEVVVVGIPDHLLYQDICACIILNPDMPLTVNRIKQRANDIFKPSFAPDKLGYMPGHFLLMDDFPKTKTGKYDRVQLSKLAMSIIKSP